MSILTHSRSGIYAIVNSYNGHRYIGSSVNIYNRWKTHRHCLRKNSHHSDHLQKAWNKYGEECFVFEVIEYCDPLSNKTREQFYIDKLHPEYNIAKSAETSSLGTKQSPETIAKRIFSRSGYKHSAETIAKISLGNTGKVRSPELRKRISNSQKGKPGNRLGSKHTQETREKMSRTRKGRAISEEQKSKISSSLKGKIVSAETKAKLSSALREWWRLRKDREDH